jgi:hypothetical protein
MRTKQIKNHMEVNRLQFECEIDKLKTLKKGMNIIIFIESKQVKDVLKDIYNFMNKPIILTMHRNDMELTFKCNIKDVYTLKKGMKITLAIDNKQTIEVMKHIYNLMDKPIIVELLVDEKEQKERLKQITPEQRKKIYAIIRDIANYIGDSLENTKENLKIEFIQNSEYEMFSLSNCSSDLAGDFIEWLINFCFETGIPMTEHPLKRTDDTDKYLEACLNHKLCVICGRPGEIHHVDAIGMGRDREKVDDSRHRKICLCREHHAEAHNLGVNAFEDKYHVYGVIWDE